MPGALPFGAVSFAALSALSLGACDARLEVTDANVGGSGGDAGAAQGGSAGSAGSAGSGLGGSAGSGLGGSAGSGPGGSAGNACTNPVECDSSVCSNGLCQPASCDDRVRNGDEAGVDCGGASDCGPCLTLCHEQCAVSDALIPVGCDPNVAPGWPQLPRSSDDGSVIAFNFCDAASLRCSVVYWTETEGPRPFQTSGGGVIAGLSGDGQLALVTPAVRLGAQSLLFSPDGTSVTTGMAPEPGLLSADGSVVGLSPASGGFNLLRKARGGDAELLGALSGADVGFTGATPDASVIVGHSFSDDQPFVYTESGGLVHGLADLPGGADKARISTLSRDGSAFAGLTLLGNERVSVFRWTQATGVVEIAPPIADEAPGVSASAMSLSDDGAVLAFSGSPEGIDDFKAYRWTEASGVQELVPGSQSIASLISADGRLVVGKTFDGDAEYSAFVWTEDDGARSIRVLLENAGVDLRGWSIATPERLSSDGRIAIGSGTCGGIPTLYRMLLPE